MQKDSIYTTANKLNPLFQQHLPQGRVQARDHAFFLRKHAFMQQPAGVKKEEARNNNKG